MASDDKTVVLITGANTGIGFETVKALLRSERRYHILLGGRDVEKAKQAAENAKAEIASSSEVAPIQIDVEDDESIEKAHHEVAEQFGRIDCLINNAGAAFDATGHPSPPTQTLRQSFAKTWDVNVTGAHLTTLIFLPLLLASQSPRLLFITSGACSLADASDSSSPYARKSPAGLPKTLPMMAYRSSKTALNLLMVLWKNAVEADGVRVWAVAPGFLATGLGGDSERMREMGAGDAQLGGEAIRGVLEGRRDSDVGRVVREYGESGVVPW